MKGCYVMAGTKLIAKNKKAYFDFQVIEEYEAGVCLKGSEVKSLRAGQVTLKDSYISFSSGEAFLQNAHISEYSHGTDSNHHPERLRKLLLHKHELLSIEAKMAEKGLSCVPLSLYFKNGRVKVKIALAKGKKLHDKRQDIKTRDANKEIRRQLKTTKH
jgi:SsrA-binding protein